MPSAASFLSPQQRERHPSPPRPPAAPPKKGPDLWRNDRPQEKTGRKWTRLPR